MNSKILFSASTGGFYLPADRDAPEDAQPITGKRHQRLLEQQAAGGEIIADGAGKPTNRRRSTAQFRKQMQSRVRGEAARRIEAVSPIWRQINDSREPSEQGRDRFAAIDAIRSASNAIAAHITGLSAAELTAFDVKSAPWWPEIN